MCSVAVLQLVNKHYICERPATNPVPVTPTPGGSAPVDCSTMPAMPQGTLAPVRLINAGGPAMCNYYAADNAASPSELFTGRACVATYLDATSCLHRTFACKSAGRQAAGTVMPQHMCTAAMYMAWRSQSRGGIFAFKLAAACNATLLSIARVLRRSRHWRRR